MATNCGRLAYAVRDLGELTGHGERAVPMVGVIVALGRVVRRIANHLRRMILLGETGASLQPRWWRSFYLTVHPQVLQGYNAECTGRTVKLR